MFTIVTRTNGARVGINLYQLTTILPNGIPNTNCTIRIGDQNVTNVVGSLDELVESLYQFTKNNSKIIDIKTPYSKRVVG